MSEREREIDLCINEHYLATPAERDAYYHDPVKHAHIHMLRQTLTATDEAMETEGISEQVRDRIIYQLLQKAHKRMTDRDTAILRAMHEAPKNP